MNIVDDLLDMFDSLFAGITELFTPPGQPDSGPEITEHGGTEL